MTKTFGISEGDASRIPKLGFFVWYECATSDVSYKNFAKTIERAGFDAELAPVANRKRAYHHAVKAYGREHYRVTVNRLPKHPHFFRHQITAVLEEKMNKVEDILGFRAEVTTSFDRATEKVVVNEVSADSNARTFKHAIDKHLKEYMSKVHVDVLRDWTQMMFGRFAAVNARKSGGLYFVPAEHEENLANLEAVLAEMDSTLYVHPVFDTTTWRKNAAGFVTDDLVADFDQMKAELDKVVAESKSTGEIKRYKLDTILGRFMKLQTKEGMYEDLLKIKLTDLQKGISSVKRQITNLTLGKVKGIEAVDTAHEIRERNRAVKRAEVAKQKKMRDEAYAHAAKKKADAKSRLEEKLAPIKKASRKKRQAVRTVVAESVSDTPF